MSRGHRSGLAVPPAHSGQVAVFLLLAMTVLVFMLLFIVASAWHMKIGMQVIIEDYVHGEKTKLVAIIANNFFSAAIGIASIYALFKLSSGV